MKASYTKGALCCLIATLSWGAMFPVMTSALTRMDPYTFTSMRYGIAGLVFLAVLWLREGRAALSLKGERAGLAWLLGSAGFVGFGFLVFLGQKLAGETGALTASIMMATMPMLGILVNWALRRVAPPAVSVLLILMSFCGVAIVVTRGDVASLLQAPSNYAANALIILGALCWVTYTVGAAFFPTWSPYRYTALTTALGMSSVLVLNAALLGFGAVPLPSAADFAFVVPHVLYMAFVAGFVGVLCWNLGNRILGPLNGVLFMDVVPLTAFVISSLSGIVPRPVEILGACITGTALVLNNLYMRRRLAPQARSSAPAPLRTAPGRAG